MEYLKAVGSSLSVSGILILNKHSPTSNGYRTHVYFLISAPNDQILVFKMAELMKVKEQLPALPAPVKVAGTGCQRMLRDKSAV